MMELITQDIEKLYSQFDYALQNEYEDKELNRLLNYWLFFENCESELQEEANITLPTVLYSKYYWSCRFVELYESTIGFDAGMEQQRDDIIEEITEKLADEVDWEFLQAISENTIP